MKEHFGGLIHQELNEEMEELRPIEIDERTLKLKGNVHVTEVKIYTGPFPVIKPTKEVSEEAKVVKIETIK